MKKFIVILIASILSILCLFGGACDNVVNTGSVVKMEDWSSGYFGLLTRGYDNIVPGWSEGEGERYSGAIAKSRIKSTYDYYSTILCQVNSKYINGDDILKGVSIIVQAEEDCTLDFAMHGNGNKDGIDNLRQTGGGV